MKKVLFLLLMVAAFVACSDDDDDEKVSTFCIINNTAKYESSIDEYLNGTMWEIIVFEYDEEGDNIGQKNVEAVPYGGGKSEKIQVSNSCVKIQVSFKILPEESRNYGMSSNKRQYIQSLGVIKKGENIDVILDGDTMVGYQPNVKSTEKNCTPIDCIEKINKEIK